MDNLDKRTIWAAVIAFDIGLFGTAGVGLFLGFDLVPSALAGVVFGALSGAMIIGVAKRAEGIVGEDDDRTSR